MYVISNGIIYFHFIRFLISMKKNNASQIVIKSVESILVIGYILFEELIWNTFAKPIYQYFKSLALLDNLKEYFLRTNRYGLLSVFVFIFALTEVMGFVSAFYFVQGDILLAMFVYISKIPIAAFTFWLFDLTKSKLLTFSWVKISYDFCIKQIDRVVNTSIYKNIKLKVSVARVNMKQLYQSYFKKDGFVGSIKAHYLVFKPHFFNFLKKGVKK